MNQNSTNQNSTDPNQIKSIRLTTPEEKRTLKPYSNSLMEDFAQCPVYGVVHTRRRYQSNARSMALEAGGLMHDMFAAVRIWQLEHVQKLPHHARAAAHRIFGEARWEECLSQTDTAIDDDPRWNLISLGLAALHTGDWYDDPQDNVRTMTNMEEAAMVYIDERMPSMEEWPIYVSKPKARSVKEAASGMIGIEQVFDVVLEFGDGKLVRFIGTVDGLIYSTRYSRYFLDENKTASRLDEAWQQSFYVKHQQTGYLAVTPVVYGFAVHDARIIGLKIKQSRTVDNSFIAHVQRSPNAIAHWGSWVRYIVNMDEYYGENFEAAPRFTHSCNRYFRPCSLIPFCGDEPEGRIEQWNSMVEAPLSPSEQGVAEVF